MNKDGSNLQKESVQNLENENDQELKGVYINSKYEEVSNLEEVENYRRALYNYKDLVGYVEGKDEFNEYYIKTMNKLENKYNELENENLLDDTEEIVDLPIERKNKFQRY